MAINNGSIRKIGVSRLALTGGIAAAVVFGLCWVGTFIPFSSPTHAYISLFTTADVNSLDALIGGGVWSLLFGAISGTVISMVYNALGRLDRR